MQSGYRHTFIEGAKEFEKFHKEKLEAIWEEKDPPKEQTK